MKLTKDSRAVSFDFVIPASPNDAFFSQIAMFRLGLDALGGAYRNARLVAVFGDSRIVPIPEKWKPHFERIEVEWADPSRFERFGFRAQCTRRFEIIRPDADVAVSCDADTLLVRPFEPATLDAVINGELGGVIAHYHFPWDKSCGDPPSDWDTISQSVLGAKIRMPHHYTLTECADRDRCPFYVNLGFLIGSPKTINRLHNGCEEIKESVIAVLGNRFYEQVATALTVAKHAIPASALPLRYNFPNDRVADGKYPHELNQVRLFHYLRTQKFDRHKVFVDGSAFEAFMKLDLVGSDRAFRNYVRDITKGEYPFSNRRKLRISGLHRLFAAARSKTSGLSKRS
jgi:hypothetical protein